MRELLAAATVVVVLAVVVFIGGGLVEKTYNVVNSSIGGSATLDSLKSDVSSTMTTLTSLLPVVILALIGGLAIVYILQYLGRTRE